MKMAINYEKVGWDTTKYINPTNMNHMDAGIKAACDKADANEKAINETNSNLEWKSSVTTSIQLPDTWREAIIYVSINGEWRNMTLSKIALEDTPFLYSVGEVTGRYFSVQASKSSIALYLVYADSKQVTGSTMVVTYK